MKNKIELLAPAGDLEKLKVAVNYGADAVYIAGEDFGLRSKAKNFSINDMEIAIKYCHDRDRKLYVAVNILAHNEDLENMAEYLKELARINVDALIVADPGIIALTKETIPDMEIHLSTQASSTNYMTANFWHQQGIKRIVLARELSFKEIKEVREKTADDLEIEAFVHGAMCMSYSGRCLLSNYLTNRDANRGECAQPCRWKYHLVEEKRPNEFMPVYEDESGTYIFNSKDLCVIRHIKEIINSGIVSLKIEGRMKSSYYVATVVKAYREAIDDFFENEDLYNEKKDYYLNEIKKCSHREFTTGFYFGKITEEDHIYTHNSYSREYDFVAIVLDYDEKSSYATIEQRNKFSVADELEVFSPNKENQKFILEEIIDNENESRESAPHPQEILKIKIPFMVEENDILRMKLK